MFCAHDFAGSAAFETVASDLAHGVEVEFPVGQDVGLQVCRGEETLGVKSEGPGDQVFSVAGQE